MKTSKLITAFLIGITAWQFTNAQNSSLFKSKYQCWMYGDSVYGSSGLMGVIYSVADTGIHFAVSASGNTFREDDRQLQFIPVTKIDYIDVRKKSSVEKGALIGLGVGGTFSFAILAVAVESSSNWNWSQHPIHHNGMEPAVFIVGSSMVGAAIGALIGSQKLQFEINRKQRNYKRQKQEIRGYAIIQ
jgi:hypothetical protein